MGIHNFSVWLKEQYPDINVPINKNNIYNHIYIDMNFILHNSIYDVHTEEEFYNKIYLQLDIIFSNFIATNKIFMGLDGPGSYAKISLQRQRRKLGAPGIETSQVNSLWITPGVDMMKKIEHCLEKYIQKLKKKYKYINPTIELSSSNECDEGEIKICRNIIKDNTNNNYKNLIIGNDADLIVLSMGLKPIYNINILIKNKYGNYLISLEKLLRSHIEKLSLTCHFEILLKNNIRDDFVVLSVMMGNDYLPKIFYVNHNKLWDTYYKFMKNNDCGQTLISNNCFNKMNCLQFFNMLCQLVPKSQKNIGLKNINLKKTRLYLEGILWCLQMYKTGICPKYDYIYNYKTTPNLHEILYFMNMETVCVPQSNTPSIPVEYYSLLILPEKCYNLISSEHKNNFDHSILKDIECSVCNKYKNDLGLTNSDSEKKSDNKLMQKYKDHKKTAHDEINIDFINNFLKYLDKKNI